MMADLSERQPGKNSAHTKRLNRATVLNLLREQGTASRASLARETGLTLQALSNMMGELQSGGLIVASDKVAGGRGQPAVPFSINASAGYGIGINLDEGQLYATLMDFHFRSLHLAEAPFADRSPAAVLRTLERVVKDLMRATGAGMEKIWGVGLAMPRLSDEGVRNKLRLEGSMWAELGDANIDAQLAARVGLPVFSENDANAGALGEIAAGAGRAVESFCYVHIARGLGCGVIDRTELFRGAWGNAGEIGRFVIDANGSYLESLLSVDGLYAMSGESMPGSLTSDSLKTFTDGQARSVEAWTDAAAFELRRLVSILENAYDPEAILVGGQLPDPVLDQLLAKAHPLFDSVSDRPVRKLERLGPAGLRGRAPVVGAAAIPLLATVQAVPADAWKFYGNIRDIYDAALNT